MPSAAYYFSNPQYDPSRGRPTTLGELVKSMAILGLSVGGEGQFGTLALYPALPTKSLMKRFFGKIPGLKDVLAKYEETVFQVAKGIQQGSAESFPIGFTGRLQRKSGEVFEVLRSEFFKRAPETRLSLQQIGKFIKSPKTTLEGLAKAWQIKEWRPFLIGGMGTTAWAMWQRADIWTLGLTVGEMAFRGLQSLGKLRNEFIVSQTMQALTNASTLSQTPITNLFGEELYYMQQNIQNHVMTRQLMESGLFENPYNMYRLI